MLEDLKLEDYPQTKEGGVDFVRDVFRSMGGKVLPPRRPRHTNKYDIITVERDAFMMDFENACLECNWNKPYPKGPKRHENSEWAAMIQSQVSPQHSDVDWEEYCTWVQNGGGDEWFQEEDEDEFRERMFEIEREEQQFLPGYYEAQTRLQTSYLCKEMVRPLSTPLDDRALAMATIINVQ